MKLIFRKPSDRLQSVSYTDYKSNNQLETVIEVSESELNDLIPKSFNVDDWKKASMHYELDKNKDIVFNESYECERKCGKE